MRRLVSTMLAVLLAAAFEFGCSTAPQGQTALDTLNEQCVGTIAMFKGTDPSIEDTFFQTAYGYAVFPSVTKAGLIVGGAHGRGQVYEKGKPVGYASVTQGTIGAQIGGQDFAEIIFFEDQASLANFKTGQFALAAQVSAVAASAGAAASADYSRGVAVFTTTLGGLMVEASVGGQSFDYESKQEALAKDK